MTPPEFFIKESLSLARSMNILEARVYLRGMLELIGECELSHDIRRAAILLDESDRQLELISRYSGEVAPLAHETSAGRA